MIITFSITLMSGKGPNHASSTEHKYHKSKTQSKQRSMLRTNTDTERHNKPRLEVFWPWLKKCFGHDSRSVLAMTQEVFWPWLCFGHDLRIQTMVIKAGILSCYTHLWTLELMIQYTHW
jgi:hypothetical protein